METTVKDRLIEYLRIKKIRKSHFEKRIGAANGYINNIKDGLGSKYLMAVEKEYPDLNRNWLLTGEGQMLLNDGGVTPVAPLIAFGSLAVKYVPVASTASFVESLTAGAEPSLESFSIIPEPGEEDELDNLYVFDVRGESMTPTIPDGAKILTERVRPSRWHLVKGVAVVVFRDQVAVKRIARNRLDLDNYIVLESDNPDHGSLTVQLADIRGIFSAIRIVSAPIH